MAPPPPSSSMANLSQTPSSNRGGDASWYDGMLDRLSTQPAWPEDKERSVLEPFSYLDANPGKEVRSKLIEAFNVWLQVPPHKLEAITRIVRMLHTASLLMDDVEDNSDLRRGIPVAHKIYGVPQTINTANYVYFLVFSEIFAMTDSSLPHHPPSSSTSSSKRTSVERLVVDELINLHRGQGMDLLWRDSLICPTEEEYVEMVNNKTGGLFRIAIKLMISQSEVFSFPTRPRPNLIPLVNLIGLLFQIRDDYMNLQSSKYAENKGFCEDLTEGKFSFPIIHSIRASALANILNVLKQRPTDLATKTYAVSYMRNVTRSFEYTEDVLKRLDSQTRDEVKSVESQLGKNPALLAILEALRDGWWKG
ncbi:terpenoid synthase [Violaceomyces palustris]|uniref:Terpenoid synthase n=1 Tax=Violaceomyces palustris TaxID=1673888 RepID=A0ACD0P542_9BASI|nr:terpenoid synthase [Violaceomyces palustris]